jgi:hypothetical protein
MFAEEGRREAERKAKFERKTVDGCSTFVKQPYVKKRD